MQCSSLRTQRNWLQSSEWLGPRDNIRRLHTRPCSSSGKGVTRRIARHAGVVVESAKPGAVVYRDPRNLEGVWVTIPWIVGCLILGDSYSEHPLPSSFVRIEHHTEETSIPNMLLAILSLLVTASQAQNSTQESNNNATQPTQIAVYPPFPIRSDTNMQHTQRAYDVSLITAISSTTIVYAISCSPWTTMTRFNDVCGTNNVDSIITVTEGPDNWQWTAQGKTLYCTNLSDKTKSCTSVTNSLGSYFAPVTGTEGGDFLAGFLEYFTTMSPVAVNLTAGFENVPSTRRYKHTL
ncbi:uncharacterized protein M421DRAFT_174712 [Didymella exigua CBS 183.55]|uniref:Uncharacterized protein n=1 Tax=Didymella exigua CBS 183.55 TaxID=1150837 RepID=A0A6A5RIT9_9PLEO|nr:uncharacterized protein M421DRAFT_174712 [Didymella exigua CBS 183.55]KAF1927752.1 hypothetical protein M421DRAFT_174712 [Didymella exigua CBS 183.55]